MGLYPEMKFYPMGDRGLLLEFGDEISRKINERVRRMALAIQSEPIGGVLETVPLTGHYSFSTIPFSLP